MTVKIAFVGFRHPHIMSLYNELKTRKDAKTVASCEEDPDTRAILDASGKVEITHSCFTTMLKEVNCDAIAIGDYFARRGSLAIQALKAGKHVIVDKPLCTSLDELQQIEALAHENNLSVGCMFTMRDMPGYQTIRRLIKEGAIGEPHSVITTGQHPLNIGTRPHWFFMPSCHGGTITDIGVHVFDVIPWLTGYKITDCCASRSWNGKASDYPWFHDCAQFMLRLTNGCGVLADVSYLAPDKIGYSVRQYWRCCVAGDNGIVEYQNGDPGVMLAANNDSNPRSIPAEITEHESYLDDFINEISGATDKCHSTTASIIETHRQAIEIQKAAQP